MLHKKKMTFRLFNALVFATLALAIIFFYFTYEAKNKQTWEGLWQNQMGELSITKHKKLVYDFHLFAQNETGNICDITGQIHLKDLKSGSAELDVHNNTCTLSFKRDKKIMVLTSTENCSYLCGLGVSMDGQYEKTDDDKKADTKK